MSTRPCRLIACFAALLLAASVGDAAPLAEQPHEYLLSLSLEELAQVPVTTVSRRHQRVGDVPASVFVITREDIRRSGAMSLPEVLRLAPHLLVARVNAHAYAISARGFNNAIGNKMQVMLDGRVLYSPLFSGVFWDTQDIPLHEIERIEVISGPAAVMWGANAVNGIINIVTRTADDTVGNTLAAAGGAHERQGSLRIGRQAQGAAWRIHARHFERDATQRIGGGPGNDAIWRSHVGFRADFDAADGGLTLQGDAYRGQFETDFPQDTHIAGGNLLARWHRTTAGGGGLELFAYVDHARREVANGLVDDMLTWNLEFQHRTVQLASHELVWGAGAQVNDDAVSNAPRQAFYPEDRRLRQAWAFVQDEYALADDLRLTGGLRLARNAYTGNEWLPTLRLSWHATPDSMLWGGVSRAVRAPSRLDRELHIPQDPPFTLVGNDDFASEVAIVSELGWRSTPTPRSSYSLTLFNQRYDRLRSVELLDSGSFVFANNIHGRSRGLEGWGMLQVHDSWRLGAGVLLLDVDLDIRPGSTETTTSRLHNDPRRQWLLRSSLDLRPNLHLDLNARHVGALPAPRIGAYTTFDMRLAWRPSEPVELALIGRNLGQRAHVEFPAAPASHLMRRTWKASVRWSW